ncbi:hypothetical protein [Candidatus Accumulibacter sp. ACC005]|nr:hypothetical protein [Candidatus Accumulibacter sp. ACC005]
MRAEDFVKLNFGNPRYRDELGSVFDCRMGLSGAGRPRLDADERRDG